MNNAFPIMIALLVWLIATPARVDSRMSETPDVQQATINLTINPEARVSVNLNPTIIPSLTCGVAKEMRVKIVNQGFLTARLEAELVKPVPQGVAIQFHPDPLRGIQEEYRDLYVKLDLPGTFDLTIAFRAHNFEADLGGRDRIHMLLRCK